MHRTLIATLAGALLLLAGCSSSDTAGAPSPTAPTSALGTEVESQLEVRTRLEAEAAERATRAASSAAAEAQPGGGPAFSCDAGADGLPVCEGAVPASVGPYRTPDGVLVGG